ncbi:MAG: hypothetical protein VX346_14485 [Planctomycetota bacterium]|nr:hypothetical protein [Planctomycetota bacterium]
MGEIDTRFAARCCQTGSALAPVKRDDELWFYYTSIKYRASPENANEKVGAVCLAVLRRDGFVSIDASEKDGVLTTQPFVLSGKTICVNANARATGRLFVEALDKAGSVMATSHEIRGDHRRCDVHWAQGDIATLKGNPVKLRFTLREAELHSFWVTGGSKRHDNETG